MQRPRKDAPNSRAVGRVAAKDQQDHRRWHHHYRPYHDALPHPAVHLHRRRVCRLRPHMAGLDDDEGEEGGAPPAGGPAPRLARALPRRLAPSPSVVSRSHAAGSRGQAA